jgi:hypothetical protein
VGSGTQYSRSGIDTYSIVEGCTATGQVARNQGMAEQKARPHPNSARKSPRPRQACARACARCADAARPAQRPSGRERRSATGRFGRARTPHTRAGAGLASGPSRTAGRTERERGRGSRSATGPCGRVPRPHTRAQAGRPGERFSWPMPAARARAESALAERNGRQNRFWPTVFGFLALQASSLVQYCLYLVCGLL